MVTLTASVFRLLCDDWSVATHFTCLSKVDLIAFWYFLNAYTPKLKRHLVIKNPFSCGFETICAILHQKSLSNCEENEIESAMDRETNFGVKQQTYTIHTEMKRKREKKGVNLKCF